MDTDPKNYKFIFSSDSSEYVELINDKGYKLYDYYDENDNNNEYQYNPINQKKYIQPSRSYNSRSPTLPLYSEQHSARKGTYYSDDIIWDDNLEYYKANRTCIKLKYYFYQACELCLFVKDKIMVCAEYIKSQCIKEKYENCENYENYENDEIYIVHENPIKKKTKINMRTPLNKSERNV
jgi:hypothetical protein